MEYPNAKFRVNDIVRVKMRCEPGDCAGCMNPSSLSQFKGNEYTISEIRKGGGASGVAYRVKESGWWFNAELFDSLPVVPDSEVNYDELASAWSALMS